MLKYHQIFFVLFFCISVSSIAIEDRNDITQPPPIKKEQNEKKEQTKKLVAIILIAALAIPLAYYLTPNLYTKLPEKKIKNKKKFLTHLEKFYCDQYHNLKRLIANSDNPDESKEYKKHINDYKKLCKFTRQ